jgi:hypothetical protein
VLDWHESMDLMPYYGTELIEADHGS